MELFEIKNLNFSYPDEKIKALSNINLKIKSGEFIVICGASGCGKTTFLRMLKKVLSPVGETSGEILYKNKQINFINLKTQAKEIGYVLQNPDNQIVTDKVWHELAFGLESLGVTTDVLRVKVAEMASYFGISEWFYKDVALLSGGQKQLLNLASIMAMQPEVLILDEPTSQLDPISASEFIATIAKINKDLGTTIIITEHRLEEVLPNANRVVILDSGEIIIDDIPENIGKKLVYLNHTMLESMPTPIQISSELDCNAVSAITVKDGRNFLSSYLKNACLKTTTIKAVIKEKGETIISAKNIWYRYDKKDIDIIQDFSVDITKGESIAILGNNGAGKTTALLLLSGILKPYRGKIKIKGLDINKNKAAKSIAVVPQNPQCLFTRKTVLLDLQEITKDIEKINEIANLMQITPLLNSHPYDLSGGEQQKCAIAKVLLANSNILILDEPTKGLDNHFKIELIKILNNLKKKGITIILVSHDIEFCAVFADRCAMLFCGSIVTINETNKFFSGNSFYTTAANKMSRHLFENAVTTKDVLYLCKQN